jgi:hypothetical protein
MGAMRLAVALFAVVACIAATAAQAVFTPAWSYVPPRLRAALAAESGGVLYLPARTPSFYRYRSGAAAGGGVLRVRFWNRVRIRHGVWRWTKQSFLWQTRRLPAGVACADWGTSQQTFQVSGNKVFGNPTSGRAWRCVTDRRGRTRVLVASEGGRLPVVALAIVVSSGLDVSGRR